MVDPRRRSRRPTHLIATAVGGFYLVMAGINIGIAIGDSSTYRHFADQGLFHFVRAGWRDIVMVHPGVWIGLLAAGEIAIGMALVGRWLRLGYLAAICFHIALLPFGWGVWLWAVPAITALALAAHHDLAVEPDAAPATAAGRLVPSPAVGRDGTS